MATHDHVHGSPMVELIPVTILGLALTALTWIYACWMIR